MRKDEYVTWGMVFFLFLIMLIVAATIICVHEGYTFTDFLKMGGDLVE